MDNDKKKSVITVKNIYKSFHLPHERSSGIKQSLLNVFKSSSKRIRGYEKQEVLDNVSFEVQKGDFFGIVGRNGSGKSTLLKLLAGIYSQDKGTVQVDGSLTPFIELGVGFNPELTGKENVFMNGALLGYSHSEMDAMYEDIVNFAEIERFMDQKLKNYSSGMQVRLAFSIAIRAQSDILLLDEVLAVGDSAFQRKCFEYFDSLKNDNSTTIVFITHDMDAVNRFCNKAILIENGKIKIKGSPRDVADQYIIDNISGVIKNNATETPSKSKKAKVSTVLSKKSYTPDEILEIEIRYDQSLNIEHYIGISILQNNQSVAELNSMEQLIIKSKQQGRVILKIDLNVFNPGAYEVNAAIFNSSNKTLQQYSHNTSTFIIKGYDKTRGGTTRIEGQWKIG